MKRHWLVYFISHGYAVSIVVYGAENEVREYALKHIGTHAMSKMLDYQVSAYESIGGVIYKA